MKLLKILERDAGIERLFDQGGPAARDQEENQRVLVAAREPIQNGAACRETLPLLVSGDR